MELLNLSLVWFHKFLSTGFSTGFLKWKTLLSLSVFTQYLYNHVFKGNRNRKQFRGQEESYHIAIGFRQIVNSYSSPPRVLLTFFSFFMEKKNLIWSLWFTFVKKHHSGVLLKIFLVILFTLITEIAIFIC